MPDDDRFHHVRYRFGNFVAVKDENSSIFSDEEFFDDDCSESFREWFDDRVVVSFDEDEFLAVLFQQDKYFFCVVPFLTEYFSEDVFRVACENDSFRMHVGKYSFEECEQFCELSFRYEDSLLV